MIKSSLRIELFFRVALAQARMVEVSPNWSVIVIPGFDDQGYLPAGVHVASLDEIAERFGNESELRQVEMDSIRWLVDLAFRAGVVRIILNGSCTCNGQFLPFELKPWVRFKLPFGFF